MKTIAAIIALTLSANAFANTDELNLNPPMLTAKAGGVAADTCAISIRAADGQTYEIDPVAVGEAFRKAGEYRINPFARFGGHGTTFNGMHSSQCVAAAGKIAAAYGIQRVFVDLGNGEVAVALPTNYVFDGHTTAPYTTSFITEDGLEVKSTLKFHNLRGSL